MQKHTDKLKKTREIQADDTAKQLPPPVLDPTDLNIYQADEVRSPLS